MSSPAVIFFNNIPPLLCPPHVGWAEKGVKSLLLGGPILMGMGSYKNIVKKYFIHTYIKLSTLIFVFIFSFFVCITSFKIDEEISWDLEMPADVSHLLLLNKVSTMVRVDSSTSLSKQDLKNLRKRYFVPSPFKYNKAK